MLIIFTKLYIKKNSELQIVVISFSDDFTKNSESLITTLKVTLLINHYDKNKFANYFENFNNGWCIISGHSFKLKYFKKQKR